MKSTWLCSQLLAPLLILLSGAHAQTPPDARVDLGGTSWQLVKFQGGDGTTLTPDDKTKYTIAFEADGHVSARIDCNRGRGTWTSAGPSQVEFGPLALTRAFCPPAPLNDQIPKQWQRVRSYTLKDGHLFLALMADAGIYEYEPVRPEGMVEGVVKGTATYRERVTLPSNAVLEATLEDVSKAEAPAETVGQARVEKPGNPPIHFEIPYDPSRIDTSHRYAVRARIMVGDKELFAADRQYRVLTVGHGNGVKLLLRRARASGAAGTTPATSSPIENTYWKLTQLGDATVTAPAKQTEPHFILNTATRRVSGSGGCNRLTGSYALDGDHLSFGEMAGTMMACLQGMDTEKAFLDALSHVNTWKITGLHLDLFDTNGKRIVSFEARHMK